MTDKEIIRAEIERLSEQSLMMMEGYRKAGDIRAACIENVLYGHDLSILSFIDSLKEEPVSEELEEAEKEYANSLSSKCDKTYVAVDFRAGAQWKKQQMIDKACKWLDENAIEYWGTEAVDNGRMIEDFKRAMDD